MNGLRAGMSAPPLMAAARVAAGVTSLTCQEPTFTGPLPNRRSRREVHPRISGPGSGVFNGVGAVAILTSRSPEALADRERNADTVIQLEPIRTAICSVVGDVR